MSEGCPHKCPWCYEWKEIGDDWKIFPLPEIVRRDIRITDMNLLAKTEALDIINQFKDIRVDGKVVYPWLVCGIDYRFLTDEIAQALKDNRFGISPQKMKNRERFYREIDRFQADPRFDSMVIMVEGSMQDFLEYSPKFNGNTYNKNHTGANVASHRSTVAGLFARGVPVLWCGNRAQAVKLYPQMVRQYCIKNYAKILNL